MDYIAFIFIGGFLGAIITNIFLRSKCYGTLVVNWEDNEPEVYAELKDIDKLERAGVYVTFRVSELHAQKKQ